LCSIQTQDGISHLLQRTSTTSIGSVTTESPLSEVGSQRRPPSLSRITGAETQGVITFSVLPDRKMFMGRAVHHNASSVVSHSSLSQLPLSGPMTYSSEFKPFNSSVPLPDAEGTKLFQELGVTGDRSPSSATPSEVTKGTTSSTKRRIVQSMSADSALLPIRSGPFPDNEIPDSSPGSLHHSPALTRKSGHNDHHKTANSLGTHSLNNQTGSTKKDPFGSPVSLHDDFE